MPKHLGLEKVSLARQTLPTRICESNTKNHRSLAQSSTGVTLREPRAGCACHVKLNTTKLSIGFLGGHWFRNRGRSVRLEKPRRVFGDARRGIQTRCRWA